MRGASWLAEFEACNIEASLPLEAADLLTSAFLCHSRLLRVECDRTSRVAGFANTLKRSVDLTDLERGINGLVIVSFE